MGQNLSALKLHCDFLLISCLAVIFLSFLLWFCVSSGCFPGNPAVVLHNTSPLCFSTHLYAHTHTHTQLLYKNHQNSVHFRIGVEIDVQLKLATGINGTVSSFLFKLSVLFIIHFVSLESWSRKFTAVNIFRHTQELANS